VSKEKWHLSDGQTLLNVHPEGTCLTEHCVLHSPSDHHMRDMPLTWRNDVKKFERTCVHGVGHPDPDDLDYLLHQGLHHPGAHGCCPETCCVKVTFLEI
jgi:hypothetical protein